MKAVLDSTTLSFHQRDLHDLSRVMERCLVLLRGREAGRPLSPAEREIKLAAVQVLKVVCKNAFGDYRLRKLPEPGPPDDLPLFQNGRN